MPTRKGKPPQSLLETDDRFPSGPWTGYFLQPAIPPGRHDMELFLTFRDGNIDGEGRDWVGKFSIRGMYRVADGKCYWVKQYEGRHSVSYRGFNEGKGIWGTWTLREAGRGGFHIWPVGMGDPNPGQKAEASTEPSRAKPWRAVLVTADDKDAAENG
jgi:hypothetical protein